MRLVDAHGLIRLLNCLLVRPLKLLWRIPELAIEENAALLHLHSGPGRVAIHASERTFDVELVLRTMFDAWRSVRICGNDTVEAAVFILADAELLAIPAVEVAEDAHRQSARGPFLEGDVTIWLDMQAKLFVGPGDIQQAAFRVFEQFEPSEMIIEYNYLLPELMVPQINVVVVVAEILVILQNLKMLIVRVADCDSIRKPIGLESLFLLDLSIHYFFGFLIFISRNLLFLFD